MFHDSLLVLLALLLVLLNDVFVAAEFGIVKLRATRVAELRAIAGSGESNTLAGLLMQQLDGLPQEGETVELDGLRIEAARVSGAPGIGAAAGSRALRRQH